jgi:hypothetical protein
VTRSDYYTARVAVSSIRLCAYFAGRCHRSCKNAGHPAVALQNRAFLRFTPHHACPTPVAAGPRDFTQRNLPPSIGCSRNAS